MNQELPRYWKKLALRAALSPLKLLPVKRNRVFIHNDLAYNYSANPRYIAEFLMERYPGQFEIVFSVKRPEQYAGTNLPIRFVGFNSPQYFLYAMTSKVYVTNSGGYSYLPLKKDCFVINTHHGGGAYKSMGLDMYEDTRLFRKDLILSARLTNVFLSTCERFSEAIEKSCLISREKIWEIGMPRNDILIRGDPQTRRRVRNQIGLADGEKLVLYAPTYRKPEDNYFKESVAADYGIDPERVIRALEQRFGGTWRMAMRLHPCVVNRDGVIPDGVMDLTDYPEMQELLLAADVMINDFSSSMWDFMLTGKPCFMFALDLKHYAETTGLYTPVSEWPFPQAESNDALIGNILRFDEEAYRRNCERHYKALGGCETGRATELVGNLIYETCFPSAKRASSKEASP